MDDDDDDDEESDDDDEEEDEPVLVIKKNVKKTKPLKEKPVRKGKPTVFEKIETDSIPEENLFLDCTSELVEETYE